MPCSYAAQFALQALFEGNRADGGAAALAMLTSDAKHSWRHMLAQGATATMEAWAPDEKPNLTWSHVWSASPGFLIPWLLFGLRCLTPGCATVEVRPAPGALTSAQYSLPTVKGHVNCSLDQPAGPKSLTVRLALPMGVEANVVAPDGRVVATALRAGEHLVRLAV